MEFNSGFKGLIFGSVKLGDARSYLCA